MVLNYYKKVTDFMNIPGKFCEKPSVAGKTGSKQQQKRDLGNAVRGGIYRKILSDKTKSHSGKAKNLNCAV